jgi:hypothetical protein
MRTVLAGAIVAALLVAPGCTGGGEKREPGANDVDAILAATSNIVFQCRAAERGFLSIDEAALDRDVDTLIGAADELDLDATFRRPELLEPEGPVGDEEELLDAETSLRAQTELAIARLEDESCSPRDAERLREALED